MAVSIDTVYQRVLTLANKEQRGYITPQEFNLLANHAQIEIFDQYFNDMNNFASSSAGNKDEYSDPLDILEEKISIFETQEDNAWMLSNMLISAQNDRMVVPDIIHRFGTLSISNNQVDIVNSKDFNLALTSRLTAPTLTRPIGHFVSDVNFGQQLIVAIGIDNFIVPSFDGPQMQIRFVRKPRQVQWAYVVVNDKALYNANTAVNFELHPTEETKLVYKILKLAGVNLKSAEVVQVGQTLEQTQIQQEKI